MEWFHLEHESETISILLTLNVGLPPSSDFVPVSFTVWSLCLLRSGEPLTLICCPPGAAIINEPCCSLRHPVIVPSLGRSSCCSCRCGCFLSSGCACPYSAGSIDNTPRARIEIIFLIFIVLSPLTRERPFSNLESMGAPGRCPSCQHKQGRSTPR